MATKQQKAVERAVNRTKKQGREREERHVLWLLAALILLLLYLLLAQHYDWWPYAKPNLGSAFYTNISAGEAKSAIASSKSNVSGSGGTKNSSGSQNSGGSGSSSNGSGSGTNSSSGSTTPPNSGNGSIATFAAGVNVGDTKAQITGQANGLGQGCAIIANVSTPSIGNQQVCTYAQGSKLITVTYLNGRVVSASKSGF